MDEPISSKRDVKPLTLKLVPNYADAQCTDLTAMAGQWRIVEYLVRSNANLETQPRRNARDGGRAPGRVSYRPYLDRHGFGACDLQFEAWAGEASVRLGGALVAGGLAYVALTGTPSPNCSSGSRVVMRPSDQPWRRNLLSPADPAFLRAKAARNMRRDH